MATFGGLETGGTWFVAAVGTGPEDLRAIERWETGEPEPTLARAVAFFERHGPVDALGVGAFGPVDADPSSPRWGSTLATPKPGWSDVVIGPVLRDALGVPVAFDTDVNAAAVGEQRWGAGRGHDPFAYLTVGTGVGGGVVVGSRPVSGALHPEVGHLPVQHDGAFAGVCPFHGDCLEGLAAGPALEARWGVPGHELPDDHEAWEVEADLLAQGVLALRLVAATGRVVLSGGVGRRPGLAERVQRRVVERLAGYVAAAEVVPPGLADRAGVLGALALAADAASSARAGTGSRPPAP